MQRMGELRDRVVIVDYPPGAHGHFVIETLHELIYDRAGQLHIDKNYHASDLIPSPKYLTCNIDDIEVDPVVYKFAGSDFPIFWPSHWSLEWTTICAPNLPQVQHTHQGYRFLEIYASAQSWSQLYLNCVFNIGRSTRQQLWDTDYFKTHFCQHMREIGMWSGVFGSHIDYKDRTDLDQHQFTTQEIVELLVGWLNLMHANPVTTTDIRPRRTLLPSRGFTEVDVIHSFDMMDLYSFDSFVATIDKILDCVGLQHVLQYKQDYMATKWQRFYNNRNVNRIFDSMVPDFDLHPVELSYREFIRRLST